MQVCVEQQDGVTDRVHNVRDLEAVVGITLAPARREGIQNAVDLLRLRLEDKPIAERAQGTEDIHILEIIQLHISNQRAPSYSPILPQPRRCLRFLDKVLIAIVYLLRPLPILRRRLRLLHRARWLRGIRIFGSRQRHTLRVLATSNRKTSRRVKHSRTRLTTLNPLHPLQRQRNTRRLLHILRRAWPPSPPPNRPLIIVHWPLLPRLRRTPGRRIQR